MIQIVVLLLIIGLVWRLVQYVINLIKTDRMRGKLFREAHDTGQFDAELEAEFQRRNHEQFVKDTKKEERKHGHLTREQRKRIFAIEQKIRSHYLKTMKVGLYQYILIFVIASVLGLFLEEIWMYINFGIRESRVGLVWGPFSPLYGFGACLLTGILWPLRNRPSWQLFIFSAVIGTLLEQITGWGMDTFAHATSWNYLALPDHITQWTAWRFVAIWGLLGLIWVRVVLPQLLYSIGRSFSKKGRIFIVVLLAAFLTVDILMTVAVFQRNTARMDNIPPQTPFQSWIDTHYNAEFISSRFQNLSVTSMQ